MHLCGRTRWIASLLEQRNLPYAEKKKSGMVFHCIAQPSRMGSHTSSQCVAHATRPCFSRPLASIDSSSRFINCQNLPRGHHGLPARRLRLAASVEGAGFDASTSQSQGNISSAEKSPTGQSISSTESLKKMPTGLSRRGLILPAGELGSWDSGGVGNPVVRRFSSDNEERWFMWYRGWEVSRSGSVYVTG